MAFTTLTSPTELSLEDAEQIRGTAKWARVVAILGFALIGLVLLFGAVLSFYMSRMLTLQAAMTGQPPPMDPTLMAVLYAVVMLVVGFISFLIHVYSIGYMSHDKSIARFMSYLSLFTFAMLMLVTSDNLIQLFFGWEGVGLASYLLIGFWYTKPSACAAARTSRRMVITSKIKKMAAGMRARIMMSDSRARRLARGATSVCVVACSCPGTGCASSANAIMVPLIKPVLAHRAARQASLLC